MIESRTFFSGGFELMNEVDRQTHVAISVSRKIAPSFYSTAGAMVSNVAQLYVSQAISRVVRLTVGANYAQTKPPLLSP